MSFATELFVFILLPFAVIGYRLSLHYRCAVAWLLGLSLAFYASAGAAALAVVLGSAIGNYLLSRLLLRPAPPRQQMLVIGIAIVGNLLLLGYFKYFGFLTSSLSPWLKTPIVSPPLALPLGISFFTFQQIAYLIDVRAKRTAVPSFRHYLLFATFFPQATSGPINYWHETVPQYERLNSRRPSMLDFSVGLTVFAIRSEERRVGKECRVGW